MGLPHGLQNAYWNNSYLLVFGKGCHLPVELVHRALWAIKEVNLKYDDAGKERILKLCELEELRDEAYDCASKYKDKMKEMHDAKIRKKEFVVGQKVWLYNSKLKFFPGKLKRKWMGPYVITRVGKLGDFGIEDPKDGSSQTVNGHRLKPFLEAKDMDGETKESVSFLASQTQGWHLRRRVGVPDVFRILFCTVPVGGSASRTILTTSRYVFPSFSTKILKTEALCDKHEVWQEELYYEKMENGLSSPDNALQVEKAIRLSEFRPLGMYKCFERLGWEEALSFRDEEGKNKIPREAIYQWMETLKKELGSNPPRTMTLTGKVKQEYGNVL
ncbi:hypothetical protein L1987_01423 [Smallanthus sonchifolius]|uniref:Uncharacterized protein n=1 Tax=Smallanthus sonchifolius TaxID=185202 RepID=A0ACB9K561_9ASTR|nr:hypothetical protein L1987_01423 [Smallanthus sonchifolius]